MVESQQPDLLDGLRSGINTSRHILSGANMNKTFPPNDLLRLPPNMTDFPITEAQLTGLFLESIVFGIYLVTFGMCLHTLMMTGSRWRSPAELNVPMIIVTGVFFVIAAFDLALGFYHTIKAFVLFTGDGGAAAEFTNISDWVNVMKVPDQLALRAQTT